MPQTYLIMYIPNFYTDMLGCDSLLHFGYFLPKNICLGKNCAKPEIGVLNRDTQLPTQTSILGCYSLLYFGYFLPKNICLGKNSTKTEIGVLNRYTQLATQFFWVNPIHLFLQCNGQCARYNKIICTAVRIALKSHNLDTRQWELVLPDALHSIRSLLCTVTNQTPNERLFNYRWKSPFATSVPTWLHGQGPVFF